ncbi:serine protease [Alteromonadaceae bacterium 2753L.S.0a.02]|nr:serine protease [Alteromonadaceae bacterium 2753L.S.0a.02]
MLRPPLTTRANSVKKYYLLMFAFLFISAEGFAASLTNGVTVSGLSAATGSSLSYSIAVPSGATNLNIEISGGSGDADLYVRAGSAPTTSSYNCRPYLSGNNESCSFSQPSASTYYIMVRAYSSFSGVSLLATYDAGSSGGGSGGSTPLNNGSSVSGLSASTGSSLQYSIAVPQNAQDLSLSISGGSGDADLYVKYGAVPTSSSYDCRPYLSGNSESCAFSTPQAGTYYISLKAYSSFSGVTLSASYSSGSGGGSGSSGATWSGFQSYYADAIGLSGNALRSALHEISARNHSRMTYSQVWSALKYTDEDPNNSNNVILLYTGRSQAKSFNSSGNSDPDAWNREHTWPKSHGFPSSSDWAYTDIHHLRPADASVNSTRSNKDYDNGGSSISEASGNYTDSDSFEPRNSVKGDIARMMFYMAVRYEGGDSTGTDDLTLVNYTGTSGANLGKLCTLVSWAAQDPVSSEEIARHARIVERQGNRNPFVDYPAWVNALWGSSCN